MSDTISTIHESEDEHYSSTSEEVELIIALESNDVILMPMSTAMSAIPDSMSDATAPLNSLIVQNKILLDSPVTDGEIGIVEAPIINVESDELGVYAIVDANIVTEIITEVATDVVVDVDLVADDNAEVVEASVIRVETDESAVVDVIVDAIVDANIMSEIIIEVATDVLAEVNVVADDTVEVVEAPIILVETNELATDATVAATEDVVEVDAVVEDIVDVIDIETDASAIDAMVDTNLVVEIISEVATDVVADVAIMAEDNLAEAMSAAVLFPIENTEEVMAVLDPSSETLITLKDKTRAAFSEILGMESSSSIQDITAGDPNYDGIIDADSDAMDIPVITSYADCADNNTTACTTIDSPEGTDELDTNVVSSGTKTFLEEVAPIGDTIIAGDMLV